MSRTISALAASVLLGLGAAEAEEWFVKGEFAESCNCNVSCPCVFGSPPTMEYCRGNSLVEIHEGYLGDVKLDGISIVYAYDYPNWAKLYVSDTATDEQFRAAIEVLKQKATPLDPSLTKILSAERAPVSIEKSDTTILFSVPTSSVELELVTNAEGDPVTIQNLPIPWFEKGYTQYKANKIVHDSGDKQFEFTGTNGAASQFEASGDTEDE